jgi:hypothetical protein
MTNLTSKALGKQPLEALGAFHCRGAARDALWIAELSDSLAKRNRRAVWGAINAPGEHVAISRDILPLASRAFGMVERV